jgi:DNA gyrase subunit A
VFFVTANGTVKKTSLEEYNNIRSSGILAIKLDNEDSVIFAGLTSGNDHLLLTTSQGQSIRFNEKDIRSMGRSAGGVTGVKLSKKGDRVVGTVIISKGKDDVVLLTVSALGYGKKTSLSEYKVQNRGGSGILTYKVTDKTGDLIAARGINKTENPDVLLATHSGKVLRLTSKQIPVLGRATQGVRLMKMDGSDKVTSVAVIEENVQIEEE